MNAWTQSNGGPLILMEDRALCEWRGMTNLRDPIDPSTDYGRAAAVHESVAVIPVGPFDGLVLNDDPTLPTTWFWFKDEIVLLRATDPASVDLRLLQSELDALRGSLVDVGTPFKVSSSPLHLFDSVLAGNDAHEPPGRMEERLPALTIPCAPGLLDVRTGSIETDDNDLLLHWLTRVN